MVKNMLNRAVVLILLCVVIYSSLYSRKLEHKTKQIKGQKYYINRCSSCHGSGKIGGNIYSMFEWQDIFANSGKELLWLHKDEKETDMVRIYIRSEEFKKESKYILRFIQEFAYDSDKIPTCN
ncbi:MAG: hypothetical protein DRG11_05910 [Epsilonproteobacteria bacterium]|nr:MAG: hypothetical protein DRG11_05910 [Campylobacterota bacterium]